MQVYFSEYIKDRPRIFKAMFPDEGQQLHDVSLHLLIHSQDALVLVL